MLTELCQSDYTPDQATTLSQEFFDSVHKVPLNPSWLQRKLLLPTQELLRNFEERIYVIWLVTFHSSCLIMFWGFLTTEYLRLLHHYSVNDISKEWLIILKFTSNLRTAPQDNTSRGYYTEQHTSLSETSTGLLKRTEDF